MTAAPSTLASADPVVVTCTLEFANCPFRVGSIDVPPPPSPLGPVGDPSPLQADTSVASVAQEATWQAPAQNSRRETNWLGSDIAILVRWASGLGARAARSRPRRNDAALQIGDGAEGVRRSQTAWVDGGFCKRAEWWRVGWR